MLKRLHSGLIIGSMLILLFVLSCQPIESVEYRGQWAKVPQILNQIKAPEFPDRMFGVLKYGVVADGKTDSRGGGIQKAIDACHDTGGGMVMVPAGEYFVKGPIHLKSNVNLHLEKDAYIRFSVNPDDYLPAVLVRWEGTACYNYSPLIYAYQQTNIAITGEGTLDGQTEKFWYLWKLIQEPDKKVLRGYGRDLVPVEERVFGAGHFLRPTLFEPYDCDNVLLEGVTLQSSPFWTIHPVLCSNVIIRRVTVNRGRSNDDGCNPESSQYVLIEDCNFNTQDDAIAIKAGRDNAAWVENGGESTENIVIRNCKLNSEVGGITIGSEMSGGVRNVFAENIECQVVRSPIFIKSNTDRGGVVEQIYVRNLKVEECTKEMIRILLDYKGANDGNYPADFRDLNFENIHCQRTPTVMMISGIPTKNIGSVSVKDLTVENYERLSEVRYQEGLTLEGLQLGKLAAWGNETTFMGAAPEKTGRLRWKDLPTPVRQAFLKKINMVIDEAEGVSAAARNAIKAAYAEKPRISVIDKRSHSEGDIYELHHGFGSDNVELTVQEDGVVIVD